MDATTTPAPHWREAVIREMHAAGATDVQIAGRLGLSGRHVGELRKRLGVPNNTNRGLYSGPVARQVRDLHAAGLCDRVITQRLGLRGRQVYGVRRHFGLPANPDAEGRVLSAAKGKATQLSEHRTRSTAYGLPPGLTRTQLRILFALTGGPLCKAQFAAAGISVNLHLTERVSVMRDLIDRGYVAAFPNPVPRVGSNPRGRPLRYFMLTGTAVELLASAGRREGVPA